jgi:hypothetical protein
LTLDGFRARPGASLKVAMQFIGAGAPPSEIQRRGRLVALGEDGMLGPLLTAVDLSSVGEGHWEATVKAPGGVGSHESYHLALAFIDAKGRLALSNTVEIICTPFHAGF